MIKEKSEFVYHTVLKIGNSGKIYAHITEEQFERILINGGKTFIDKIKEMRNPDTTPERKKYLKMNLSGLAFQSRFRDGIRKKAYIQEFTGELFLEEDGNRFDEKGKIIKFSSPEEAREKRRLVISEHWQFIKYAFDSPSGRNHYVIRVTGLSVVNYKEACKYVGRLLGILIDPLGNHASRLATLSYDPKAYINKKDTDSIDLSSVKTTKIPTLLTKVQKGGSIIKPIGHHLFFTQSLADVHLTEFIERNKENIIFYPEGYIVCINKLPIVRLMGRTTKITDGERNSAIFHDFSLFVSLNGCNRSEKHLYNGLRAYNQKWCVPALDEDELLKIFNNVITRYNEGNLEVSAYDSNGAFFSWSKLSGDERKGIASASKKHRNILLFLDKLISLELSLDEKKNINIKKLSLLTHSSPQTIYNYQKFIWEISPIEPKLNPEPDKGSFFKNDIYSLTINSIILNRLGQRGLYDFGFLNPPLTITEAINQLVLNNIPISQKSVAEKVNCSIATIKRSHAWKNYTFTKSYEEDGYLQYMKKAPDPVYNEDIYEISEEEIENFIWSHSENAA